MNTTTTTGLNITALYAADSANAFNASYEQAVNDDWGDWFLMRAGTGTDVAARRMTASHPDTAGATLVHLLTDPDVGVRLGAVKHRNLPVRLLSDVVDDPDMGVRAVVAERTRDRMVLNRLAEDEQWVVRAAVVANPVCSASMRKRVTQTLAFATAAA